MEKFVRGPFTTIDEVKEALNQLRHEGYPSKDVTIVANRKEDLDALKTSTTVDVSKEDGDGLNYTKNQPYWNELNDRFSGFLFNNHLTGTPDSPIVGSAPVPEPIPVTNMSDEPDTEPDTREDDHPRDILASFKNDLEDGKIVILVEDTRNIEAKFNLDAIDHKQVSKDTPKVDKDAEIDADPSQVMKVTITERDSHPDIESDEDVLEQETTYVPTDSVEDEETNRDRPIL